MHKQVGPQVTAPQQPTQALAGHACTTPRGISRRQVSVQCSPPSTAQQPLQRILRKAKTKEELKDPVRIGATGSASTKFQVMSNYESLTSYMLLPVEQYFVLDPKQIAFLGGNRFILTVPRIHIFNAWLEAVVEMSVTTQANPPRVVLQAENCRITGSDLIERLRLDQRFCMRFNTEVTWSETPLTSAGSQSSSSSSSSSSFSSASSIDLMPSSRALNGNGSASTSLPATPSTPVAISQGELRASAQLDVWSEVVAPFNLLPRRVLESTSNAVMRSLVNSLLPWFTKDLAADYQKWAGDQQYRVARATRTQPLA